MFFKMLRQTGWVISAALVAAVLISGFVGKNSPSITEEVVSKYLIKKEMLAEKLGPAVRGNQFPTQVALNVHGLPVNAEIEYALDPFSQVQIQKQLEQYSPDYAAFVAVDATTGRVLSMASYTSDEKMKGQNLAVQATFPAASIFKVVTASAAIDMKKVNPDSVVPFNGANHTLYKKNVKDTSVNRWTRFMTLKEAFGRSVNVFFGKLGLYYVGPQGLAQYAQRYKFNEKIESDMLIDAGAARIPNDDGWAVVQAASGFTQDNTMSPMQGALIAAAVANDGVMMEPYLVDSLYNSTGDVIYKAQQKQMSVTVSPQTAEELRELMHETVRAGTSRKSFRKVTRYRAFEDVEFGGKTGSLTGTKPKGKCDWFVGYARGEGFKIAVAALTVNKKNWKVKSSQLASAYLSNYIQQMQYKKTVSRR